MQKTYELVLIFHPSQTDDQQKKQIEEMVKIIEKSGKVKKTEALGKKAFAYPIKKEKEGFYWLFEYECIGKEAAQLLGKIRLLDPVIRFLLVVKE